jgi:hemoglobin
VNAIAMVADRFSDAIIENPKLQKNPALREWNESGQLAGLKFMRTLWACEVTGGPFRYTGKQLVEAHKHRGDEGRGGQSFPVSSRRGSESEV